MSRHRNIRKVSIGDDDYDDDISSQSYDEKYAISPTTRDMYMYNRNNDSHSMSHFMNAQIPEEDDNEEDTDVKQEVRNGQEQQQLQAEPSDFMFQMDKEPNFTNRTQEAKSTTTKKESDSLKRRDELKTTDSFTAINSPKSQKKTQKQQQQQQPQPQSRSQTPKDSNRTVKNAPDSATKLQAPQFPLINDLKISSASSNENLKKAVDKEQLLKAYEDHTAGKDVINLIVIGHVDAGKSTLMGHLLYQLGQVSGKQMHKYKQESQKIGKGSFAYAWILDETEEERSRGVTIDIAQTKFETEKKIVNLLDAPGHKDFIPNMITGAAAADSAILVINSITGEFETGFELGGQTREHSLLVKSLGVSQIVVAVNKMDMCDWSKDRFYDICKKLGTFLMKQVGFKESDIMFVPCSGLIGENLTQKTTNEKLTSWYNEKASPEVNSVQGGLTLLDCINRFKPCERPIDKPLRFSISDVYKGLQTAAISLAGKMEAGTVKLGDKITIVPSNETGIVKAISINDEQSLQMCFAGDSVILNVSNIDINNISIGNFVCDPQASLMPVSDKIRARIIIFNLDIPMIRGFPVVFHYKSLNEAATVKKIISQLDKSTGDVIKEKPRFLNKGMSALVELKINRPICVELYSNYRELGRFMLRYSGTTIAAGIITDVSLSFC